MGHSSLPYTDPWVVLGVHKGASRDEIKAAFRRAAMACHPDVDPSPSANARFADIKAAADVLLKGGPQAQQPMPGRPRPSGWAPGGAAAAGVPRNRTGALWAGLAGMCVLAFVYGAMWTKYVTSRAGINQPGQADSRLRDPTPQRRKLLAALMDDKLAQQAREAEQQQTFGGGRAAAAAAAATTTAAAAAGSKPGG